MERYLKSIYYDPSHEAGYGGISNLVKAAKEKGFSKATKGTVKKWLMKQETYALSKPARRNFQRSHVTVEGLDAQWEADLMDFSSHQSKHKNESRYVLVMEDIFSRYVWTRVLKSKTAVEVAQAMKDIFNEGRKPKYSLFTDKGKEFHGTVKKLLKDHDINHIVSQNEVKAGHVERVIKTLRTRIFRYMFHKPTHDWTDVVQAITKAYNRRIHRSLGVSPESVNENNESEIRLEQYLIRHRTKFGNKSTPVTKKGDVSKTSKLNSKSDIKERKKNIIKSQLPISLKPRKPKYKVGSTVRISRLRSFSREYHHKWAVELFKVRKVYMRDGIPIYQLNDWDGEEISGTFYEEEMSPGAEPDRGIYKVEKILKSRKNGRRKEVLVKWYLWPEKFNSWIPSQSLKNLKKT